MKRNIVSALKLFALACLVLFAFNYISANLSNFKKAFSMSAELVLLLSAIAITSLMTFGLTLKMMMEPFDKRLSALEWFALTTLGTFANLFLLQSAAVIKGTYLKKYLGLPYTNALVIFVFMTIIQLLCACVLALIGILYNYITLNLYEAPVAIFTLCLTFVVSLILFFPQAILKRLSKDSRHTNRAGETWCRVAGSRITVIKITAISGAGMLLTALSFFIIYNAAFGRLTYSSAVIISSLGLVARFVPITPGSIGVREAIMSYVSKLLGHPAAAAAAAACVERAIFSFWVILLGAIFAAWYIKKMGVLIPSAPADPS